MKRTFTFLLTALFLCVGMVKAAVTDVPEMSTEGNIKWYTIKNVRQQKYATYAGESSSMTQQATVQDGSLFYFTGTVVDGVATVKIHNAQAGELLCAGTNSWTAEGVDWYIAAKADNGLSISKTADFSGENSWNDFQGGGASVDYWTATDAGSIWEIELFGSDIQKSLDQLLASKETPIFGEPMYSEEAYNALVAAYNTFKAEATVANYNACKELIAGLEIYMPQVGQLYHIEAPLFYNTQGVHKALFAENESLGWKTLDMKDEAFCWTPVETEKGLAWKNVKSGKYLLGQGANNTLWTPAETAENAEFSLVVLAKGETQSDYQYAIVVSGRHMHANNHDNGNGAGSTIVSWETNAANSASAWTINVAKDPSTLVEVTVNYSFTYEGEEKYTQTATTFIGEEWPAITVAFPLGVSASKPEGTIAAEENTDGVVQKVIELAVAELPFVAAESYETITTWYHLNIRDDGPTFMYYDPSVEYIKATEKAAPLEALDAYSWAFIGNRFDGFSIVNKAAGETMVLSAPVAPTENQNAAQLARLVAAEGATGNLTWNLKTPTHNDAPAGAFYVEHPTVSAYALNRQGYNGTNTVCYWNQRDTGSAVQAIKRDDAATLQTLVAKAEEYLSIMDGNTVGYAVIETESQTAIDGALATATKAVEDKAGHMEAYWSLKEALESASATTIQPETGKFYTIESAMNESDNRSGQMMYVNKDSLMQFRPEHNDSAVFQFVAAGEGKYYLYNVKNQTYLSTANAHGGGQAATKAETTETAKPVVITNMGRSNVVKIVPDGGAMLHAQANGSQVVAWDNESNTEASAWIIVETTYTPTGIETITTNAETVIYDLSGRRVAKMEKGIYIVNGKKVIK